MQRVIEYDVDKCFQTARMSTRIRTNIYFRKIKINIYKKKSEFNASLQLEYEIYDLLWRV